MQERAGLPALPCSSPLPSSPSAPAWRKSRRPDLPLMRQSSQDCPEHTRRRPSLPVAAQNRVTAGGFGGRAASSPLPAPNKSVDADVVSVDCCDQEATTVVFAPFHCPVLLHDLP